MKRSPVKVVELCVYILIIIAAIVWLISAGGDLYHSPGIPPPEPTPAQTTQPSMIPPPAVMPKGEILS